jgi:ParB family chromosome partitioning protein
MSTSKKTKPFQALGVDALFGKRQDEQETKTLLSLEAIVLPESQPRRYFDPDKMAQLVHSIRTHGILQPLLVRPHGNGYQLVAGERRYRAALEVGLTEVPAIVRDLTDEAARQLTLIENLHREDLNPVEEVEGILQLLALSLKTSVDEAISDLHHLKNKKEGKVMDSVIRNEAEQRINDVFDKLGQNWYSFTCNRLPLLNLPEDLLRTLREGKIAYTKARVLSKIKAHSHRQQLLDQAIAEGWSQREIQQRVREKLSILENFENEEKNTHPPQQTKLRDLTNRLTKSKLWQSHPQAWKKVETRLKYIEKLLAELESEVIISETGE